MKDEEHLASSAKRRIRSNLSNPSPFLFWVWALWQMHDKGQLEGQYGLYCPQCQEWCETCPEKREQVSNDNYLITSRRKVG